MQLTFTPVVLGCVNNLCKQFVPDGAMSLLTEEGCKTLLQEGLDMLIATNPAITFIGKCVSWGVGI
jgi:hypothetical protein